MNTVVIGVGSNIDPHRHIEQVKKIIASEHHCLRESRWYTTKPVGFTDQADFVNGALLVQTDLGKDAFRSYLKDVETRCGRKKSDNPYGPRTIDLDIVVWNGEIVDDDFYRRDFLQKTVREVVPFV